MRLYTEQTKWAARVKPGMRTQSAVAPMPYTKPVICEKGVEIVMGSNVCPYIFVIEDIFDDGIILAHHANDPKYDKTWEMHIGDSVSYRTHSVDAGYYFTFTLKE